MGWNHQPDLGPITILSFGERARIPIVVFFFPCLVPRIQISVFWTAPPHVPGSINSHYFHIIGDGKLNPIVGVYTPIIRIPSLKVGCLPSQKNDFWPWHTCFRPGTRDLGLLRHSIQIPLDALRVPSVECRNASWFRGFGSEKNWFLAANFPGIPICGSIATKLFKQPKNTYPSSMGT